MIIAEKPSVARGIACALSDRMRTIKNDSFRTPAYLFNFSGKEWLSTSVIGHLMEADFVEELNSWDVDDRALLKEGNVRWSLEKDGEQLVQQLSSLVKNARTVYMALDNDEEGENIAFEIVKLLKLTQKNVLRMRFSAVTPEAIKHAVLNPDHLNVNISNSVAVRQELDLKIGASFTRYFTKLVKRNFKEYPKLVSYGPCQTPTLCFCVQDGREVQKVPPQTVYVAEVTLGNGLVLENEFSSEREAQQAVFDAQKAQRGTVIRHEIT